MFVLVLCWCSYWCRRCWCWCWCWCVCVFAGVGVPIGVGGGGLGFVGVGVGFGVGVGVDGGIAPGKVTSVRTNRAYTRRRPRIHFLPTQPPAGHQSRRRCRRPFVQQVADGADALSFAQDLRRSRRSRGQVACGKFHVGGSPRREEARPLPT